MPRGFKIAMRWAVSRWGCSAMVRPSMRLDGATSRNGLEGVHVDDRSVRPALIQRFFTCHDDAFSHVILQHQISRRAVEIVDHLAGIEALQSKIRRRLNAHGPLDNAF